MAEWLKAAVLKTVVRKYRGFESYSLRQSPQQPTWRDDRVGRWCSPAKRVWGLYSTEGSNPSLSAIYRPRTRNVSGVFLCAPIIKDGNGSTPTVPSAALHTHPITLPPHPGTHPTRARRNRSYPGSIDVHSGAPGKSSQKSDIS